MIFLLILCLLTIVVLEGTNSINFTSPDMLKNKNTIVQMLKRAKYLFGDNVIETSKVLALFIQLYDRKLSKWLSAASSGFFVKSAESLNERLALIRSRLGHQCNAKNNSILYLCTITKYDGRELQEWLVWQILVTGVQHIILYVNGPDEDQTLIVIQPFVAAGYVTPIIFLGRQNDLYSHCLDLIRLKSCYFSGTGNISNAKSCQSGQDYDVYIDHNNQASNRVVWLAGFDTDEFPIVEDNNHSCMSDILWHYESFNGLMLPWYNFGHSFQYLVPSELVTLSYFNRGYISGWGKSISRVYWIRRMWNGHMPVFKNGITVNETFTPHDQVYYTEACVLEDESLAKGACVIHPTAKLYHYQHKSIQSLIKKYIRGSADEEAAGSRGRRVKKPFTEIALMFQGHMKNLVYDDRAVPMGMAVQEVLCGNISYETCLSQSNILTPISFPQEDFSRFTENDWEIASREFRHESYTVVWLGLCAELLYLKRDQWCSVSLTSDAVSIKNTTSVSRIISHQRDNCGSVSGSAKQLLVYTIAHYHDEDLQEWLVWHLAESCLPHIIVYVHSTKNITSAILEPFVHAGLVTVTELPTFAYNESIPISNIHEHAENLAGDIFAHRPNTALHIMYLAILDFLYVHENASIAELLSSPAVTVSVVDMGHGGHFLTSNKTHMMALETSKCPIASDEIIPSVLIAAVNSSRSSNISTTSATVYRYMKSVQSVLERWVVGDPLSLIAYGRYRQPISTLLARVSLAPNTSCDINTAMMRKIMNVRKILYS